MTPDFPSDAAPVLPPAPEGKAPMPASSAGRATAGVAGATSNAASKPAASPDDEAALTDGKPGSDDSVLESLGKAVSSPIEGAAEDEESLPPAQPPERQTPR